MNYSPEAALLVRKQALLEQRLKLKRGLPHKYGWKHYKWSREFFESTNKENFLVAANQIGKSSVNIRKCIEWATNQDLWPKLWDVESFGSPNQLWYLYPTREVASVEFRTKWKQFLPSGEFKSHPVYGWTEEVDSKRKINAIHFNSGVSVYFKTYAQNVQDLQTGTVYAIFCDEELPVDLLSELQARLNATDGYFHLVFTATLGQEHWRRCIMEQGSSLETHKGALKLQVSLFDCRKFEDGTDSHWTMEKIRRAIAKCINKAEIDRRIYGKFVVSEGLIYSGFDHERNSTDNHPLPTSWMIYSGTDIGTGGSNHPAAIVFVAVSPDYKQGRVFRAWRGDEVETEPGDILNKYRELRANLQMVDEVYDYGAKDYDIVASRLGESFTPANKSHDFGIGLLNTLLRHGMLKIQRGDPEIEKLVVELTSLNTATPKTRACDDLCDALRYVCAAIPWDLQAVEENIDFELALAKDFKVRKPKILSEAERIDRDREKMRDKFKKPKSQEDYDEFAEWQELYDFG